MDSERIKINVVRPQAYTPLFKLDKFCRESALTTTEYFLIEIRASQINGCAYCVQMHVKEAVEKGEKQYRIHALSQWEDTPFFSAEERIILAMTEEITQIAQQGLTDELYAKSIATFGGEKVADIIMTIININAWNRIGRATRMTPQASQS
ncbi:MAG: carboxymuconolactone decarboxylase family protein [Saprospiraceae bacterium]|nr:carboxymuconolactone decarboxylase family protein [Saprospiraceae bacterium]